jgi:hypothetical protein
MLLNILASSQLRICHEMKLVPQQEN